MLGRPCKSASWHCHTEFWSFGTHGSDGFVIYMTPPHILPMLGGWEGWIWGWKSPFAAKIPSHFTLAWVILQRCEMVKEETTAIKDIGCLFSLIQSNFPLFFCLWPHRSPSALLEEILSNPLGFFYFGNLFWNLPVWSTASLSYRMVVQYISGLKQHISFISSQKIPQNPDRYCVCGKKPLDSLFCGFLSVGEARHTIQLSGVSTFSILYRHSVCFSFFFTPSAKK